MSEQRHAKPPRKGTLGRRIFDRRRSIFLTQAQLAEAVGVSQAAIAQWERNVSVPALRHRERLAGVLHEFPHALFADIEAGPTEAAQ